MTVRTITAECTSGDGTTLKVSTSNQAEGTALQFSIGDQCVWVSRDDLYDLLGFQQTEARAYDQIDWGDDEDEDEGDDDESYEPLDSPNRREQ